MTDDLRKVREDAERMHEAILAAGIAYEGELQFGFIKGWDAAKAEAASTRDSLEAERDAAWAQVEAVKRAWKLDRDLEWGKPEKLQTAEAERDRLRAALALAMTLLDSLTKFIPKSDPLRAEFMANITAARSAFEGDG